MTVLLSTFFKGFRESFLTTPILPYIADEHDRSYKNSMKTLTKWFRKYIFWMNTKLIFEIDGNLFCHPS
jgi:hypothetical protein